MRYCQIVSKDSEGVRISILNRTWPKLKVPYYEKHVFPGLHIYKAILPEPANSQNEETIPSWFLQSTHW